MGILDRYFENSDEENQRLYRSWGDFLTKKDLFKEANIYYSKYLENDNNDAKTLYHRSTCYCGIARTEDAVKDAKAALHISPHRLDINLQVPDALFDLNDFENSKIELHNNARKYDKIYGKPFENRLDIINENYSHSLGDQYGVFAQNNNIVKIAEDLKAVAVSNKPLWKLLKEQEKCDVVSIIEKEQEFLHPREIERRQLCYRNFTQLFLHKGAKDLEFLEMLRNNKVLLLPQTTKSTKKLRKLVNENYDTTNKFLKMLQARGPVYTQKYKTGRDALLATREKENHMLRFQYQNRRDMFDILKKLNFMRSQGKLDELSKIVDHTIREYVIIKTYKVMPRKFEFINEVCNILALAYIDQLKIPDDIMSVNDPMQQIQYLLNAPVIKEKEYLKFVFGDKSTFKDPEAKDLDYIQYKKRLNMLEHRLRFARFPIEKSYFYHEIGIANLKQCKYDMCITVANKMITEAKCCNNQAWIILGYHLICKTLALQLRLQRLNEAVNAIAVIVKKLKIFKIYKLFKLCSKLIVQQLKRQKNIPKASYMRVRFSK